MIGTMATTLSPVMSVDFSDPVDPTAGIVISVDGRHHGHERHAYNLAFGGQPTITFSGGEYDYDHRYWDRLFPLART